jgi:hypothetical protein
VTDSFELSDHEKDSSRCVKNKMNTSRFLFSTSPDEIQPEKMKNASSSDDDNLVRLRRNRSRRKLTFQELEVEHRRESSSGLEEFESPITPLQLEIGGKPPEPCPLVESSSGTPPIQIHPRKKSHSPSSRVSPLSPPVKLSTTDSPSPTPMLGLGRLARPKQIDPYSPTIDSKNVDSGLRRTTTFRQLIAGGKDGWEDYDSISSCSEDEGDESSDQEVGSSSRRKKKGSFDRGPKIEEDTEENFCQFLVEL